MTCGSGGCSTGGCGGGCSSGGCNKLNTFDWLAEMDLPPHKKPFDIVEVRFKGTRKEFYRNSANIEFYVNEYVVVEVDNGYDIGKVSLKGDLVKLQLKKYNRSEDSSDFRKIIRKATDADVARLKENQELEVPTMYKARSIAMELGLSMKLSDVEYQGDRRKAVFYYTAEERVDFRELIKRLADAFKVRIEMRQIGYRQEAGRLGGIGSCGRELCCSTWLTDFKLVHTNAARYQNLSLNQLKLSGQCGKMKCCLNFELDSYLEALREFPENNNLVLEFAEGKSYKVIKTDILKRVMWFAPRGEMGGDWISFPVSKAKEYAEMNSRGEKPELVLYRKESLKPETVELDFQNDMGLDSLTRLDEREKSRRNPSKNKGNNPNKPRPKGPNTNAGNQGSFRPQNGPNNREKREQNQRPNQPNPNPIKRDSQPNPEQQNRPQNPNKPGSTEANPNSNPQQNREGGNRKPNFRNKNRGPRPNNPNQNRKEKDGGQE